MGQFAPFTDPCMAQGLHPPHVHVSECRASQRNEGNVRVLLLPRWFPWFCSGVAFPSLPTGALARCTCPSLWRRTLGREPSADWWVTLQQDVHPVRPRVRLRSSVGGSQASSQRRSQKQPDGLFAQT